MNNVTIIMPAPLGVGLLGLDRALGRPTNFLDMRKGIIALIATIFIIRLTKKLNIKMLELMLIKFLLQKKFRPI